MITRDLCAFTDLARRCAPDFGPAVARAAFLVAPDGRENDVLQQIRRPAFSKIGELNFRYLPYGELLGQQEAIVRFGSGLKPIFSISKSLSR